MTARHPAQWYLLIFGLTFLATSGARLYIFLSLPSNIWWTPPSMSVSPADSKDRVQILMRGTELNDLLGSGRLQLAASALTPSDVTLRFNNWDRVRAERLPAMLISAATAGSAATLLLVGVVLWSARRREGEREG